MATCTIVGAREYHERAKWWRSGSIQHHRGAHQLLELNNGTSILAMIDLGTSAETFPGLRKISATWVSYCQTPRDSIDMQGSIESECT